MASRKPIQARTEPSRMFPLRISRRNKPGRRSERSLFKAKQRKLSAGLHRRSTAIWIQLGLSRPKSKRKIPASSLRPPVRIMDLPQRALLHQRNKRPTSHSRAVKNLCGSVRTKRRYRVEKVFAILSVPRPHGCGIPAMYAPDTHPHDLSRTGNGPRQGEPFPTASAESKRPAREQKLWGGPPARL